VKQGQARRPHRPLGQFRVDTTHAGRRVGTVEVPLIADAIAAVP